MLKVVPKKIDLGAYDPDLNDPEVYNRWLDLARDQIHELLKDALAIATYDIDRFTGRWERFEQRRHPHTIIGQARRELKESVNDPFFEKMLLALNWKEPSAIADQIINRFANGYDLPLLGEMLDEYRSIKQGSPGKTKKKKELTNDREEDAQEESS